MITGKGNRESHVRNYKDRKGVGAGECDYGLGRLMVLVLKGLYAVLRPKLKEKWTRRASDFQSSPKEIKIFGRNVRGKLKAKPLHRECSTQGQESAARSQEPRARSQAHCN